MIGPALGRIGRFPWLQISESDVINVISYDLGGTFLLLVALVIYDRVETSRLHIATKWGAPIVFAAPLVFGLIGASTGMGRSLVRFLM